MRIEYGDRSNYDVVILFIDFFFVWMAVGVALPRPGTDGVSVVIS